jgi:hypothetical protein
MTKTRDLADLGGGFIQAGTGAQQRTVESKLQDVVSVLDFIPAGTNTATTDCSPYIQAALNKVQTNLGGTVIIPPGEYKVTSPLTAGQGIQILGLGTEFSTKLRAGADFVGDQVLEAVNGSSLLKGAQIKNLRIQLLNAPDGTDGIVLRSWYDRGILENVLIDGLSPLGRGIVVTNNPAFTTFKISQDWTMRNCQVFKASGAVGDGTSSGNGTGHCFDIFRSNEFTMDNCRANGNALEPTRNSGFHFVNCFGGVLTNVHAHGTKYGIWVETSYDPADPQYGLSSNATWNAGLTILGPTYEAINNRTGDTNSYCLYIKGTTGVDARTATHVNQLNPRNVDASLTSLSNVYMEHARWCKIECGKTNKTTILTLGDGVQDCTLYPVKLSKLTVTGTSVLSDNVIVLDSPTSDDAAWNFGGYGCILNKTLVQAIPTGAATAIEWGTVVKNSEPGFHDALVDATKIIIPAGFSGLYDINAQFAFGADASGVRRISLYINGSEQTTCRSVVSNNGAGSLTSVSIAGKFNLNAGAELQIFAFHDSTTPTLGPVNSNCRFSVIRI